MRPNLLLASVNRTRQLLSTGKGVRWTRPVRASPKFRLHGRRGLPSSHD